MDNPNLVKITKEHIALAQLSSAVKMYKAHDYISCLTLLAAAEEILGKIMVKRKGSNWLKGAALFDKNMCEYLGMPISTEKISINKINYIINHIKHNETGDNEIIKADFENEAAMFFVRAVKNYYGAFERMPKYASIISLFDELTM